MQRFFFDYFDGAEFRPDHHGVRLEDLAEVADHAAGLVIAATCENIECVGSKHVFVLVRDARGVRVYIASCDFVGMAIDPSSPCAG